MERYITFSKSLVEEREKYCSPLLPGDKVNFDLVKKNTGYFMYHLLGMRPYLWQYYLFKLFDNGEKRILINAPRQYLGKSTALSVLALKYAFFNLMSSFYTHYTTQIGIISATEEQSKNFISNIKTLMYRGDKWIEQLTKGKYKRFFTIHIKNLKSTDRILFDNGSKIISFPPTDRVRGYTFNILFIDEMAFIEDDNFFTSVAFPTINKTNGYFIGASTPRGQRGLFFEWFMSNDDSVKRLWLHYTHIENKDELNIVLEKKKFYESVGRLREFEQEYEAKFVSDVSSFFQPEKVDEGVDENLVKLDSYDGECDMGIDFGMVNSNTVITISTYKDGIIKLIYHYIYPVGSDDTLVEDIKSLLNRFNIQRIIVDDCPEGYHYIQRLENEGLPVVRFSFRRDKVKKYFQFRSKLHQGKIKYYYEERLIREMKSLVQEEGIKTTKIHKSSGETDDFIDSFVLSSSFYLEDDSKLEFYDVSGEKFKPKDSLFKKWFGGIDGIQMESSERYY